MLVPLGLLAAAMPDFAHAAGFALDGCGAGPATPEARALLQAQRELEAGDSVAAKAAIASVRKSAADDPVLLLWAGSLLAPGEEGGPLLREAVTAAKRLAAKHGPQGAPIAKLYEAAALVRLGEVEAARALLAPVSALPGAYAKYSCRFLPVALALADAGLFDEALALLRALAGAAPGVRSIHDARIDVALRGPTPADADEAFAAGLASFPADVEFVVRKANRLKLTQGPEAALALLEPLLVAGEASPSLLGEYLGLISRSPTEAKLAHYQALADAHPDFPALRMITGVLLHYLRRYEESSAHLERASGLLDTEPRVAMYLAMNYFHTPGKEAQAEELIERAARATRSDPDVYYCRAVISVRKDPAAAARDLERYLALTAKRRDVSDEKQARVRQTLALVQACAGGGDPRGCIQRDLEQAKALAFAEHLGPTAPGTQRGPEQAKALASAEHLGPPPGPSPQTVAPAGAVSHRARNFALGLAGAGLTVALLVLARRRRSRAR